MTSKRKKRFWSDEEKRSICRQTLLPGVSVAQVARRYEMNDNLIFKWLKDRRFTPDVGGGVAVFLPVEIDSEARSEVHALPSPPSDSRIEITLVGGHRVNVEGRFDPDVLARFLKGLVS